MLRNGELKQLPHLSHPSANHQPLQYAMPPQPKSAVKVIFGAMIIGHRREQSLVTDLSETGKTLDIFQSYGHNEVDTSRYYGSGSSEEYLGKLNWQERGIVMDTKFYPTVGKKMD